MDANVKIVVEDCTRGSDESRLTFPEVIGKLMAAGVERYRADLVRSEKTYYLPSGESIVVRAGSVSVPPVQSFSASGVEAAVRAIQAQRITYAEFCARISSAGCTDYLVSLAGRRAIYSGRTGESYVEAFPGAT